MGNKLTKRNEDYSKWYNELVVNADLAENSGVRGCMVIKPYGFAIWGNHIGLELYQSNVDNVIWVRDRLLLVRTDLDVGKNDIEIVLTI